MFFGESQARYVITSSQPDEVEAIMKKHGVPVRRIGVVTDAEQGLTIQFGDRVIDIDVQAASSAWHDAIPAIMSAPAVVVEPEPVLTGS
jgi:phosphoribosylformylglycinamidine (FGAM) synthase-like enzyme